VNAVLKILYRCYRIVSGARYALRRRLTAAGWLVVTAVLVAAFTGVDTDTTVAYQGFTPLLALCLLSVFFLKPFATRVEIERRLPRFATVGKPVQYTIALRNLGSSQRDLTLIEDLADPRPSFHEWKARQMATERRMRSFTFNLDERGLPTRQAAVRPVHVPNLTAGGEAEVSLELTPLRRGLIRFQGVTLARPDPFGLVHGFSRYSLPQTLLVLPRRYRLPAIALPGHMKYQEGGVALAANVGQSDEFVSLREYRRGDPLRHIHWRSWAKAGKPIVREFEDEFFVRHALVLDTFIDDPQSEAFEEAVSVAASFACTIDIQESLLDLLFVGNQAYCFTAGRGLAHAEQMLEILASVRPCADKAFSELEHLVLNRVSAISGCICVLLAWDPPRREFVRRLRALEVPLLVLVVTEPGEADSVEPGADAPERFHVLDSGRIAEALSRLS